MDRNILRIIAGKWRSRKLSFSGEVDFLRPTTDRVRETLFNWLQQKIVGARCLDLFSGSGALAFESCSRGATSVTAIDVSNVVTAMLKKNCQTLDCSNMEVITYNAEAWLKQNTGKYQFDIVFLDPPYHQNMLPDICKLLAASNLLAPGAVITLESDYSLADIELPSNWHLLKKKKAGRVYFGVCEQVIN